MDDPLDQIDPFIAIDGYGNTLCGPYLPFSLVRLGPDTLPPHKTNGYISAIRISRARAAPAATATSA